MSDTVLVERREGWTKLVLNRPDRLNAFNPEMQAALLAAVQAAGKDRACRALLLTGAGRGFCAGQDLGAIPAGPTAHVLEAFYNPLIRLLRGLDLPVICAVNGVAAGAGANIALACDIVLAARSARFLQAFVRIGLVPDAGGTYALPRLAGDARARGMAILGEPVEAETAERWGLIWRVVDDADLIPQAEAMCAQLATQPTAAIGLIKQALNRTWDNDLGHQLALEADLQRRAAATADHQEGVRAFLEKRPPHFTGGRT
jgi:2-(1,2-epoxy-1,2-dihydrophenyl)acetyl-CoA isomerase